VVVMVCDNCSDNRYDSNHHDPPGCCCHNEDMGPKK
jgi:hypothetical protein